LSKSVSAAQFATLEGTTASHIWMRTRTFSTVLTPKWYPASLFHRTRRTVQAITHLARRSSCNTTKRYLRPPSRVRLGLHPPHCSRFQPTTGYRVLLWASCTRVCDGPSGDEWPNEPWMTPIPLAFAWSLLFSCILTYTPSSNLYLFPLEFSFHFNSGLQMLYFHYFIDLFAFVHATLNWFALDSLSRVHSFSNYLRLTFDLHCIFISPVHPCASTGILNLSSYI